MKIVVSFLTRPCHRHHSVLFVDSFVVIFFCLFLFGWSPCCRYSTIISNLSSFSFWSSLFISSKFFQSLLFFTFSSPLFSWHNSFFFFFVLSLIFLLFFYSRIPLSSFAVVLFIFQFFLLFFFFIRFPHLLSFIFFFFFFSSAFLLQPTPLN